MNEQVSEADRIAELESAVNRVRRMHPRGQEEQYLAPGLWCPGCGEERSLNGFGECRTRRALEGQAEPHVVVSPTQPPTSNTSEDPT